MRLIKLSAVTLVFASLALVTGCSHSAPVPRNVADTSNDASWTPPGEMDLAFDGVATPRPIQARAPEAMLQQTMQPNLHEVPKHKVHAATY